MKKVINIFKFLILALFTFLIIFMPAVFTFSYIFFDSLNYNMIYKKFNLFVLFIIFIIFLKNFLIILINSKFVTNNNIKKLFRRCLLSVKYRWLGFILFLILDIAIIFINSLFIKIEFYRYVFLFLYYAFSPAYLLFLLFSSKNNLNIIEKTICLLFINFNIFNIYYIYIIFNLFIHFIIFIIFHKKNIKIRINTKF